MKDFLGQPIEAGDAAIYVSGGRYVERMAVRVVETRKRVRVVPHDATSDDAAFWADSSSLAVVGRFKTFKPQSGPMP